MKLNIDFSGVTGDWRDAAPSQKQIDMAYKYCPRRTVDRWLEENRTKGFFSMLIGYIFDSGVRENDAYNVDWSEIERWYDHPEMQ